MHGTIVLIKAMIDSIAALFCTYKIRIYGLRNQAKGVVDNLLNFLILPLESVKAIQSPCQDAIIQ